MQRPEMLWHINVSFESGGGDSQIIVEFLLTADYQGTHLRITTTTLKWNINMPQHISVLNSNFTISVILRFVNNTAISGGSKAFEKQSHMMVNFE